MLKHENMNATDSMALAFTARKRCEKANRASPSPPGKMLNAWPGEKTNIPFHGNQRLAKPRDIMPRASTKKTAKKIPALHFTSNSRKREIGRERIIRNVP